MNTSKFPEARRAGSDALGTDSRLTARPNRLKTSTVEAWIVKIRELSDLHNPSLDRRRLQPVGPRREPRVRPERVASGPARLRKLRCLHRQPLYRPGPWLPVGLFRQ